MGILRNVRALNIITGILIATLVLAVLSAVEIERRLNDAHSNKFISAGLANDLRQSSQNLTRLARTYVITGDVKYKQQYWDIVNIRSGNKAREDGTKISATDIFKKQGFT